LRDIDRIRSAAGTALLSNNGPLIHLILRELLADVTHHFDDLCFSHQVGALKPDPRAFLRTLERLGVVPELCVFVDDAEQNVEGALAVGLDAFCFVSAEGLASELQKLGLG
jgi:HAD superfamily hydrolase (TIGR01509 family)